MPPYDDFWTKDPCPDLSDEQLEAVWADAVERLRRSATDEVAAELYRREVLPLEATRIRRAAARYPLDREPLDLLFVSVGGQADSPALATLATPAAFVVLLHSEKTAAQAHEVVARLGLSASRAACSPIGDGENPLLLYGEAFRWWNNRGRPARVGFDLTGGLKTMSAAAAVAGFALPGARVFYIRADQPRICGRIYWTNEKRVEVDNPLRVFGELRRSTARDLLASRRYAEAAVAYGELHPATGEPADEIRARLSQGYEAIERMDFGRAATLLRDLAKRLDGLALTRLDLAHDAVVSGRATVAANAQGAERLARFAASAPADPIQDVAALRTDECHDFVALLVEMACRREREGQYDVAALLAYRASEAVVQRRLALRGIDASSVDWPTLAAAAGLPADEALERFRKLAPSPHPSPPAVLGRAAAYAVLAALFPGDVATREGYARFAGEGEARNRSILAHGARKIDPRVATMLIDRARLLADSMLGVESVSPADALWSRHRFLDVTSDYVPGP